MHTSLRSHIGSLYGSGSLKPMDEVESTAYLALPMEESAESRLLLGAGPSKIWTSGDSEGSRKSSQLSRRNLWGAARLSSDWYSLCATYPSERNPPGTVVSRDDMLCGGGGGVPLITGGIMLVLAGKDVVGRRASKGFI